MQRKKILIFIEIDVVLRHFIANETFKELENSHNVIYVFNKDRYGLLENKIVKDNIPSTKILTTDIKRERQGRWFLLYIIALLRQQGKGKHYEARVRNEIKRIGKRNFILAKLGGLPFIYNLIRRIFILKLGIHRDVEKIILREKPDLILHPSLLNGYFINELFRIRSKYKIPLIILMNSWDNPAGRAFCTGSPDKLVVWGEQTKRHAKKYMLLKEHQIECFGAAQFEVYKIPPAQSRDELGKYFNVDAENKILLYAGAGGAKYETVYLQLLEKFIDEGLMPNCKVIYRPHPWRGKLAKGEKDFFSINWKHIVMDPTMKDFYNSTIRDSDGRMNLADYRISNKLLTLADAVISPLSTMLIESLIKGKPVLAFFPNKDQDSWLSIDEIHFSEFLNLKDVNTCFKEKDFYMSCKNLFNQIGNKAISSKLKNHSEFFVTKKSNSYGIQLKHLVDKL